MGCAQSKMEGDEAVARCKERRLFMKEAVAARNAFAAAHSAYAFALRDTGAAVHDYALVEAPDVICQTTAPLSPPPPPPPPPNPASSAAKSPLDAALPPPPPPPPPEFPPSPLQRAASMPDLPPPKPPLRPSPQTPSIREDAAADDAAAAAPALASSPQPPGWDYFFGSDDGVPAKPPAEDQHRRVTSEPSPPAEAAITETPVAAKAAPRQRSAVGGSRASVSFMQILIGLDDHFLKAYESAQGVSGMLEAKRLHYHSNFADNRGHIDHSARVMRAITWNRSFRGLGPEEGRDDFETDSLETHATILDKLLAWEKKLFDEVKASERMKFDYQRKVAKLNKLKKHGASSEALAVTKAEVSHLHTRYIVDMQSMDSTVSEIQRLRDVQLYEKLTQLVRGMAEMWETMQVHHEMQLKLVEGISAVDVSNALKETSDQLRGRTCQLCDMAARWSQNFQDLIAFKKKYVRSLNDWLRLNLIPIESSLTEKASSPVHRPPPPIKRLLQIWHEQLEKIHEERAKAEIGRFAAVMRAILEHQDEELRQRERCEDLGKDFLRKQQGFEDWHQSYLSKRSVPLPQLPPSPSLEDDLEPETGEAAEYRAAVKERQLPVEMAKKKLEEEKEKQVTLCKQAREKSVSSLKVHLPELFRAMRDFSHDCAQMYKMLGAVNQAPAS
ncbi:protein ROLLING AND ERECT LEAF 2-like [Wolffia australiana]